MLQPTWTAKRDVVKVLLTTCCAARTDQDTVPRSGKFGIMYKRAGQRVLINSDGDMIVRILSSRQNSVGPTCLLFLFWIRGATACTGRQRQVY